MSIRVTLTGLAIAAAALAALLASQQPAAHPGTFFCGFERWPVKTLSDSLGRRLHFTLRDSSVDALRRLAAPTALPQSSRVRPVEWGVYRLHVLLVQAKAETDEDLHLVIADPRRPSETMIVEFPKAPVCTRGATLSRNRQMQRARAGLIRACGMPHRFSFTRLQGSATIVGVGFFDFLHGQSGVAPNGIELHPVLVFRDGRCSAG